MTGPGETDPMVVPANERGVVRVFALNMRPQEARFLSEPGAVDQALGVAGPDPAHTDIIAISDLGETGLSGYLTEGCGIPADQIDKPRLDSVQGYVLVVRSTAFGGRAATLDPSAQISLIGRFTESPTDWTAGPVAPRPSLTQPAPQRTPPRVARAQARRLGFGFFAVVVAVMVLIVVWLAT